MSLAGQSTITTRLQGLCLRAVAGGLTLMVTLVVMLVTSALWQTRQVWQLRDHRIVIPAQVNGLVREDNPATRDAVHQLRHGLERRARLTTTGAV